MKRTKKLLSMFLCFFILLTTLNLEGIGTLVPVEAATHTHTDACYNGTKHSHSGNTTSGGACYTYSDSLVCGTINRFLEYECSSCSATGSYGGTHYKSCGGSFSARYDTCSKTETCSTCNGSGSVSYDCSYCTNGTVPSTKDCSACDGGYVSSTKDCSACDGGYVSSTKDCSACVGGYVSSTKDCPSCTNGKTTCTGSVSVSYVSCYPCGGTGYKSHSFTAQGSGSAYTCGECGKYTLAETSYSCSNCSTYYTTVSCRNCGYSNSNQSVAALSKCSTCSNCDGDGTVRKWTCSTCGAYAWSGSSVSHGTITCTASGCNGGTITTKTKCTATGCSGGTITTKTKCTATGCSGGTITTTVDCSNCYNGYNTYTCSKTQTCSRCNGSGSILRDYYCSTCGATSSSSSGYHNSVVCGTYNDDRYVCNSCGGAESGTSGGTHYKSGYYLSCTKTVGAYYSGSTQVSATCDTIITGISAVKPTQTITSPSGFNSQVTVTYMDGHTSTATATSNFNNSSTYSNSAITLTLNGKSTAAGATKNFTTTTSVTTNYSQTVNYVDKVDNANGTTLGSSSKTVSYGTSVSGAEKGTSTTVGAYYTGYKYSSCTSATVGTSTVTVYRFFTKVNISYSASGWSGTYNGSPHGISVTATDATVKYGTSSGSYTLSSSPTYTNAGNYTVYYQITKSGYDTITGSKTVSIAKKANTLTLSATSGSTNHPDKTTYTFTVTKNESGGTLSVSSSNTSVATATISGNTVTLTNKGGEGTTTITVTSASTTNYNSASTPFSYTVNVNSYTVTCKDVVGSKDGTVLGTSTWSAKYGSTASGSTKGTSTTVGAYYTDYQYASSTSATVTTDGATVYRIFNYVPFKLGTNVSASDYTGSYDANAHGISVSTTISGATIKYGTTAGTYNLTANPTYKNVGTYTVYYQISKTGYTTITGSQKVTITKATNNKLTLSDTSESVRHPDTTKYNVTISQTFDGALSISNISNSSVANVTLSGNTLTLTNKGVDGTVTVTVKAAGTDNFNEATATFTYTVNVNSYNVNYVDTVTNSSGKELGRVTEPVKYGSIVNPTSKGTSTTVGAYYTDYTYSGCSSTATVGTNGATVYRYFTYTPFSVGSNVTVTPYSGIYDGKPHTASVTSSIAGATIKYGTTAGSYTTTNPSFTDAGTYTVYYQISKTGYTTITGSTTVTITQKNNTLTLSATSGSTEYPNTSKHTFTVTTNESGGTLKVSSSNTSVAVVSISGNTVTITNAGGKGTATITVTSDATRNYKAASKEYTYTVTYNKETVNYVDLIVSDIVHPRAGDELGRVSKQITYKETVKGSDIGAETTTGKYYTGYYYVSCTEATVPDGGTTVYRYFKPAQYTVTLNKGDYVNSVAGAGTYYYDDYVTISADIFPMTNTYVYTWNQWSGTFTQAKNEYTFTMPAKNVTLSTNVTRTYNLHLQTIYVRYQQADGSWGDYKAEINKEYYYNDTVTWSFAETDCYKTATLESYVVKEPAVRYVDVERKQYTQTLYTRNQLPTGNYEEYVKVDTKSCYYGSTYSWSYAGTDVFKPNSISYTVTGHTTEYMDINRHSFTFDINGKLDDTLAEGLRDYGKFDVYINGILINSNTTDCSAIALHGSTYQITNIRPNTGFNYNGSSTISGTITENTVITIPMTANFYKVTFQDVDSATGEVLGTYVDYYKYNTHIIGTILGTNNSDNFFHNAYYYDRTESIYVAAHDNNIVRRFFKLRTVNLGGNVNWIDKSNAYGSRPDSVTITLYRNGEVFKTINGLTSNDVNNYSFTNLQKYSKETGQPYNYTLSQSTVTSKNPDDKYVTSTSGTNFTNSLANNQKFIVQGAITWVDDGNEGYRPANVKVELYRNGTRLTQSTLSNTATAYTFTGLDKYDEDLVPYVYTTKEIFTAQYLVNNNGNYTTVDAYDITVNGLDFTNTFIVPNGDIVPVKPEFNNRLIFNKNVSDNVNIVLKQFKTYKDNSGNTVYSETEYNGFTYNFTLGNNTTIDYITAGRYEVVILGNKYSIKDMSLSTNDSMSLINENGTYYIEIADTNKNMNGEITLNLTVNNHIGYQTAYASKCYFATVNYGAYMAPVAMFSYRVSADKLDEFRIIYHDSQTIDENTYHDLEGHNEAFILDFVGDLKENQEFLGWATIKDSEEPEYYPGDVITLEETVNLYPVILTTETEEDSEQEDLETDKEIPEIELEDTQTSPVTGSAITVKPTEPSETETKSETNNTETESEQQTPPTEEELPESSSQLEVVVDTSELDNNKNNIEPTGTVDSIELPDDIFSDEETPSEPITPEVQTTQNNGIELPDHVFE